MKFISYYNIYMPKKKLENAELVAKYVDHITEGKKVSEGTIKTYKNIGNNLPFNILTTQPTIVKKLKSVYSNPNTLQLYLNMIILLRRYNKEEVDKLIKFRNSLRDEIVRTRKKNLNNLNDDLPTVKYLNDKLDKLSGTKYIFNYLMINHTLRNKDLNLIFVKQKPKNPDENYIFLKNKGKVACLYITDYKTEGKYGDKVIEITDKRFINELKSLKLESGDPLLALKNGKKITSNTTFNDRVLRQTIDYLGQNKIAKIVIKDLLNKKDFDKLEQLSKDRGTSLDVILKSYNLHNNDTKTLEEPKEPKEIESEEYD